MYINNSQYARIVCGVLWSLIEIEFSTPIITSLINRYTLTEMLLPKNSLFLSINNLILLIETFSASLSFDSEYKYLINSDFTSLI